jgi:hypothetical protein
MVSVLARGFGPARRRRRLAPKQDGWPAPASPLLCRHRFLRYFFNDHHAEAGQGVGSRIGTRLPFDGAHSVYAYVHAGRRRCGFAGADIFSRMCTARQPEARPARWRQCWAAVCRSAMVRSRCGFCRVSISGDRVYWRRGWSNPAARRGTCTSAVDASGRCKVASMFRQRSASESAGRLVMPLSRPSRNQRG